MTFNGNDFKEMVVQSTQTGVINISQNLRNDQIDTKLTALLSAGTKIQYPFIVNMLDHLFALKTGPHHTIYDRDQKSLHISYSVE